jgi:hypothetical protein
MQILCVVSAACLICPLILVTAWQPSGWLTLTLGSAYFWGTLLLWSTLMFGRAAPRPVSVPADAH